MIDCLFVALYLVCFVVVLQLSLTECCGWQPKRKRLQYKVYQNSKTNLFAAKFVWCKLFGIVPLYCWFREKPHLYGSDAKSAIVQCDNIQDLANELWLRHANYNKERNKWHLVDKYIAKV